MLGRRITMLLVEDNPGDARLVREALADAGSAEVVLEHVDRFEPALARLAAGGVDVVLLDLLLPDASGLETVTRVRGAAPDVPIVVFTGLSDEALALQAMRSGAQDYLIKGQLDGASLVRSIRYALERQRMALELERTGRQQLELKDRLLSHVSHELRTPLHAINGFVTLLMDGLAGPVTSEQSEYLRITSKNVMQLGAMIGDLLDATRADAGKLVVERRRASLPEVVADTVQTLGPAAAAKRITLHNEVRGDLPDVYADPRRIRQVLNNLVENAIKFTPEGGRITVAARCDGDPAFVRVSVSDSGCGIAPDASERVFERLHQEAGLDGAHKGLGLGLYLCKALVGHHGGRIWVESRVGQGSTFHFTLPRFVADAPAARRAS